MPHVAFTFVVMRSIADCSRWIGAGRAAGADGAWAVALPGTNDSERQAAAAHRDRWPGVIWCSPSCLLRFPFSVQDLRTRASTAARVSCVRPSGRLLT